MNTIKPTDRKGNAVILGEDGVQVGTAFVRASKSEPGYVTVVSSVSLDKAVRLPADWLAELDKLHEPV